MISNTNHMREGNIDETHVLITNQVNLDIEDILKRKRENEGVGREIWDCCKCDTTNRIERKECFACHHKRCSRCS